MSRGLSVLFVPDPTERVASTRYRVRQYVAPLESLGIPCRVFPALSDETTRLMLLSPTLPLWRRLAYYARLLAEKIVRFVPILALAARYRVVFIHRATFPLGLERLLRLVNPRLVFDFDDSIFMCDPDDGDEGFLRRFKGRVKALRFARMLDVCRAAVVENDYLGECARLHCPRVVKIPGPIDTERFRPRPRGGGGRPVVGWIGSPSTTAYLPIVAGPLERLSKELDFEVRLIGGGAFRFDSVSTVSVDWSLEAELSELARFDVGIMPMPDTPWSRGKLGVKMLIYMACGIVPIVSYTSTNAEAVRDGVNGFLVQGPEEWYQRLRAVLLDPALRERLGAAGRKTVEEGFSVKAGLPKLLSLLESLESPSTDRPEMD